MSKNEREQEKDSLQTRAEGSQRRGRIQLSISAFVTAAVLILVARFVDVAIALAVLCLVQMFSTWRLLRLLRKERSGENERTRQIQVNYESVVAILSTALGLRDRVTADSSQRVSMLSSTIAHQIGLRKEQIRLLESAAVLHDVGKFGIAEAVLSKPGELTDEEWLQMKRHPETGHEILSQVEFLADVADIVHGHHERFDGQGYPRGLKGEDIPIGSRIYAVADAYVAMTTTKPYRKAMDHGLAVREIVRHSLTQFDPEIVRAFLDVEKAGLIEGRIHDLIGNGSRRMVLGEV